MKLGVDCHLLLVTCNKCYCILLSDRWLLNIEIVA